MLIKLTFASLFIFCNYYQLFSTPIIINSAKNKSITIYFTGAQIDKTFQCNLAKGKSIIKLIGVSKTIDEKSLQIYAPQQAKIISSYLESEATTFLSENKNYQVVIDSIQMINKKIEFYQLQIDALNKEKVNLEANGKRIGSSQGLSIQELESSMQYFRKKMNEINSLLIETETKLFDIKNSFIRLDLIRTEMLEKASNISSTIVIEVEAPEALTNQTFEIKYYTNQSGWAPSYNIFATTIDKPLDLEYKAQVYNNTGEDWSKTKLLLIAGNPINTLTPPELETWVLSYRKSKRNGKVYGSTSSGSEGNLNKTQIKNSSSSNEYAGTTEIELEEGILEFPIEGIWDIPSNNKAYSVSIGKHQLKAEYKYRTIPKLNQAAYLIAYITNWEEVQLIEGEANVFINNNYTGKSYIDPLSAGDTLEFSLGIDPSIHITRVKKKDINQRGLIGLQRSENFEYEIDVRNMHPINVTIEVIDQFPIAQQSEIEIKTEKIENAEVNDGNGKITWNLAIPAQKSVKLKMGYTVKYPKDKVVIIKRTGRVVCPKFM